MIYMTVKPTHWRESWDTCRLGEENRGRVNMWWMCGVSLKEASGLSNKALSGILGIDFATKVTVFAEFESCFKGEKVTSYSQKG